MSSILTNNIVIILLGLCLGIMGWIYTISLKVQSRKLKEIFSRLAREHDGQCVDNGEMSYPQLKFLQAGQEAEIRIETSVPKVFRNPAWTDMVFSCPIVGDEAMCVHLRGRVPAVATVPQRGITLHDPEFDKLFRIRVTNDGLGSSILTGEVRSCLFDIKDLRPLLTISDRTGTLRVPGLLTHKTDYDGLIKAGMALWKAGCGHA